MPRATSVQLTDATDRQVADLQEVGFGSFTTIARLAIDRMWAQEIKANAPYVRIFVDEGSLFSGWEDMELYNVPASIDAYAEQLQNDLLREFGGDIIVAAGEKRQVVRNLGEADRAYLDQMIADVYESYEWLRFTRVGIEEWLERGLFIELENNVQVAVHEVGGTWRLNWHKAMMPPHLTQEFGTAEALIEKMLSIAEASEWRPLEI